ncbi:hypothetical protein [Brenneria alni]|nr:hypothetical protein [Brenneria alni]
MDQAQRQFPSRWQEVSVIEVLCGGESHTFDVLQDLAVTFYTFWQ